MLVIAFPYINPVAISIGPFNIYWYALAYIFGILGAAFYAKKIVTILGSNITIRQLDDFISYAIIGIVLGGRIGHVLFYDPIKYFHNPIKILKTYEGGMSFHGGIAGLLLALTWFCYKNKIRFLEFTDILAVIAPIGLFLGRIANFINAELYGRITDVPWAMIFPGSDGMPRHPSQLYEAFFEGIMLFIIISYITFKYKTLKKMGYNSGLFGILYSLSRIIIENFREPDTQLGFFFEYITMGQLLSVPMLIIGLYLLFKSEGTKSIIIIKAS